MVFVEFTKESSAWRSEVKRFFVGHSLDHVLKDAMTGQMKKVKPAHRIMTKEEVEHYDFPNIEIAKTLLRNGATSFELRRR